MKTSITVTLCCLLALVSNYSFAQAKWNSEVPKQIIIVKSTKDYNDALTTAKEAAKRLNKKLDLRGLSPNAKIGLSMSQADCNGTGGSDSKDYPCYEARGDGNATNDDYISIEYSSVYKGLTKGYYIVVAGITDVKSSEADKLLAQVKKVYNDAYGKRTMIWYGDMN
ncbi:hypothetical protein SAMN05421788_11153 [Filimonas lacunae]|uniref:Uncharacterized protein n=1 Tax=Filimonas lacunae TaxID=477680 RepID=A0A173MB10_9BACT|nr:hypothetical protein [Filimonas lacunae]BAV04744.1 hypothetical protein FLA_0743 [Filimonas lacunae]SIT32201.1 hypothetical protein SAMN05421788_11153 [Filimonas lacunae]